MFARCVQPTGGFRHAPRRTCQRLDPMLAEYRQVGQLVTVVVEHYDLTIEFFVEQPGFDLVEDSPSLTNDGLPKRWVVVRPPGGLTGILLAQAESNDQKLDRRTPGRGSCCVFFGVAAGQARLTVTSTPKSGFWRQKRQDASRSSLKDDQTTMPCARVTKAMAASSNSSPATSGLAVRIMLIPRKRATMRRAVSSAGSSISIPRWSRST